MLNEKMCMVSTIECYVVLISFIHSFAVASTSPVAQSNEMNTVLVYALAAVAGFIVVIVTILLISIAAIRCKGRRIQQGKKGIYS